VQWRSISLTTYRVKNYIKNKIVEWRTISKKMRKLQCYQTKKHFSHPHITHILSLTHAYAHTHTCTRTHAHTHTHTPARTCLRVMFFFLLFPPILHFISYEVFLDCFFLIDVYKADRVLLCCFASFCSYRVAKTHRIP